MTGWLGSWLLPGLLVIALSSGADRDGLEAAWAMDETDDDPDGFL